MTTLPSHDRPGTSTPATSPTLAVVVTPAEANTAYPDTTHSDLHSAVRAAPDRRTVAVARATDGLEVLVGVWLAVSPWVVGSGGSRVLRWNDVAIGAVLAVLAAVRITRPAVRRTPSVSFGLGAWTIVAAFVLSFQNGATGTAPLWNAIACGAALTAAAAWTTTETERATVRRG